MAKKLVMDLSQGSIEKTINDLERYKNWVEKKTSEIAERLADLGRNEATVRFEAAEYSGDNDAFVYVEPIQNGWKIIANGSSVFFIEFGAGVYYNGSEPYPEPRPSGVVGIGEYGKGKGKQQAWGFYDEGGELVITRGTPAAMPMYHAALEMEREIRRIAKEVFA